MYEKSKISTNFSFLACSGRRACSDHQGAAQTSFLSDSLALFLSTHDPSLPACFVLFSMQTPQGQHLGLVPCSFPSSQHGYGEHVSWEGLGLMFSQEDPAVLLLTQPFKCWLGPAACIPRAPTLGRFTCGFRDSRILRDPGSPTWWSCWVVQE